MPTRRASAIAAIAALLAVLMGPTHSTAQPPPQTPDEGVVTVLTRNLYLGADVGAALDLLPDLPAAAQQMWDQVAATDFDRRADLLAAEAARHRPDVIGVQEATVWHCREGLLGGTTRVYDFLAQYVAATREAGVPYVIAEHEGSQALNPGYEIPPIPFLTRVEDPATFQPLFGSDSAYCGFTIGDALLVREDLATSVRAAGTTEYEHRYAVVPVVFTIDRGFAWADLEIAGTTVRFVTTHLESAWDEGAPAPSAEQSRQLVDDLAGTTVPLVVMGDFNADPRDPRPAGAPNPAEQPTASDVCPAQPFRLATSPPADSETPVDLEDADATCNAFWTMLQAGYDPAGPDPFDPAHFTYGASDLLAGPDPQRLRAALELGNASGFTDRLDYVFVANGAVPSEAGMLGHVWPQGEDLWECSDPAQVANTEAASQVQADAGAGEVITGRGVCLPTDHAGVLAVVDVAAGPTGVVTDPTPPAHESFRIGLLGWLGIAVGLLLVLLALLVTGVLVLTWWLVRRRRGPDQPGEQGEGPGSDEVGATPAEAATPDGGQRDMRAE